MIRWEAVELLYDVILYVTVALGIPGNILSAIVWLRRHVASNNSSAVYLAALAINDLVYLFAKCLQHLQIIRLLYDIAVYLTVCSSMFESLLVLSFSTERLIAIVRPLQVCLMFSICLSIEVVISVAHYLIHRPNID